MKLKVLFTWLAVVTVAVMAHAATSTTLRGKCTSVTDGDTIKVLVNNQEIKIRLNGIDTPEKKQAFGTQAKNFTSQWAFGKDVVVYQTGTDRYKRVLGWVFIGKRCLNRDLVYNGMAWWYRQYAPKDTNLAALEQSARQARRGLWVDPNPVAPWEWRKQQRKK